MPGSFCFFYFLLLVCCSYGAEDVWIKVSVSIQRRTFTKI